MIKHKIIELLKVFDKNQMTSFSRYLRSPYHNRNTKVTELYDEIIKFYPEFSSSALTKENLHTALYKENGYKDSTIRGLLHQLEILAVSFISFEEYILDPFMQNQNILDYFIVFRKMRFFEKYGKFCESNIRNGSDDLRHFYYNYLYESDKFMANEWELGPSHKKAAIRAQKHLTEAAMSLFMYFVLSFGQVYANFNVQIGNSSIHIRNNPVHNLLKVLDLKSLLKNARLNARQSLYVKMCLYAFEMFSKPNSLKVYLRYKDFVFRNFNRIPEMSVRGWHLVNLRNFIAVKCFSGKRSYLKHLFTLEKTILEKGIHKYSGEHYFIPYRFIRMVETALALGEHKYAADFIRNYQASLPEDERINTVSYCNAFYYLAVGKAETALEHLKNHVSDQPQMLACQNVLRIMIFYELGYFRQAQSGLTNLSRWIKKEKTLGDLFRKSILNFAGITRLIVSCNLKKNVLTRRRLRNDSRIKAPATYAFWIEEKIKLLGN